MNRRQFLSAGMAAVLAPVANNVAGAETTAVSLHPPAPMAAIAGNASGDLLAVTREGELWQLDAGVGRWTHLADRIDPLTPLAGRHARVAARHQDGGLWVLESGRATTTAASKLAPAAGLCILPAGIIGVVPGAGGTRLARFEPDAKGRWVETARSDEPVLPDARPFQADLAARTADDGHIVVLGGPDPRRYRHGVLGDDIESTRVLYLERHGLEVLRSIDVQAPDVIEDIAPRPVVWREGTGLLTMRSGPRGAQLVVIAASTDRPDGLEFVALGAPIGTPNRWLAATTDGTRIAAVHTPHLGGDLVTYRVEGRTLQGRSVAQGVSNHQIGSRDTDLAVWLGDRLAVPGQDRRSLRCFDAHRNFTACGAVNLPDALRGTAAMKLRGRSGVAVLLDNGELVWVGITSMT